MGVLHSEILRGKEIFSFDADSEWLKHKELRGLDPDLLQISGKQYLSEGKSNFGLFLDSSPDRWGRMLMRRREAIRAREEGRTAIKYTEADYLLGVYDGNRSGALRFKTSSDGDFMDNDKKMTTPPWTSIRDLEYASLQLEQDEDSIHNDKWLNMLVAPGSSLGGARPKANILDSEGSLWIAKFPSNRDDKDSGAWEAVAASMAKSCGILMSECKSMRFNKKEHTFLTKRFDRVGNDRIIFVSAMTMLGYVDGSDASNGVSYLELAEWIERNCNDVSFNLEQLWRRIVFNIAVSNCDDHLRNHGFLFTKNGWSLSPAFDINPDELGNGLKLNVSEEDNSLNFDLALSVAGFFGIDNKLAVNILSNIKNVVSTWRKIASFYDISRSEQDKMESAFRYK